MNDTIFDKIEPMTLCWEVSDTNRKGTTRMTQLTRRTLLTGALATTLLAAPASLAVAGSRPEFAKRLRELEEGFSGRLGVCATRGAEVVAYRADERFALASTFKALAAAAILRKARRCESGLLAKVIHYTRADLVEFSPITEVNVDRGMTVAALCDAAVRYSDNTAANLLLRELGGPGGITRFARSLGDPYTRLDRWETELNTNLPGDVRDTTTPAAMAGNLHKLVLGRALTTPDRAQLTDWLVRNTTGDKRIRAGVPDGWRVGDKTGTPAYGGANDVAVAWPPTGAPLVISVYTTRTEPDLPSDDAMVAEITRAVVHALT
jgi:beta-lactamase class A